MSSGQGRDGTFSTRAAGILLPLTSLPSRWGIGDLGPEAESFLDYLESAGQSLWQILPLGPTEAVHGHSPYMSPSAFAGNPLLISPDRLQSDGWLEPDELPERDFYQYLVRFDEVWDCKQEIFQRAFAHFCRDSRSEEDFHRFRRASPWLRDYALFTSLGEKYSGKPWYEWPPEIARRQPEVLAGLEIELAERIAYHEFLQFLFDKQWRNFKSKAARRGIRIIGDLPIYVALNSVDVWAHQECFQLDPTSGRPQFVAGVPPDYFSPEGQSWGNPLYNWGSDGRLNPAVVAWWEKRLARLKEMIDIIRIDHFRGFEAYWRIPAGADGAAAGEWATGPGAEFFRLLAPVFDDFPVIAEDLGTITPAVEKLRSECGFAGMKVLQFAFDQHPDNPYLPWNFRGTDYAVYSGTHDNETTVGWYLNPEISEASKAQARRAANSDGSAIHLDFIRLAYASTAALAIIPMQDVLGFGNDCRMNRPGSNERNWAWRCAPRFLTPETAARLKDLAFFYNRFPGYLSG
ncbi:MAG: 4-alpha-glucanotransferase [Deltaproteobacteria bacterium]|nr:4-alpha-glucanotransferase [Deltaproteobacteria bacterium]